MIAAAADDDGAPDLGQCMNPTNSNSNSLAALGVFRNGGRGILSWCEVNLN